MSKWIRQLRYLLGVVAIVAVALLPATVVAGTTATVTIDVTPSWVSITNTNTSHDFGTLGVGVTNATANSTIDYFDVQNEGSVAANVTIKCDGWTHQTGSHDWTYGAPAADTGQIVFSVGTAAYDTVIPESPSYEVAWASLSTSTTDYFEVGIDMPSSFTHGDQQRTTITLTASAA